MTPSLRRRLKRALRAKTTLIVARALQGCDANSLQSDLRDLETYTRLIKLSKPRWGSDSIAAVLAALISVAVSGLLWSTKVPRTNLSLVAETDDLRGDLNSDLLVERVFT